MASPTGVALQVHSSECRKGRLENQGLKITLDYPAALKPARAAGDPVSKKKKTNARPKQGGERSSAQSSTIFRRWPVACHCDLHLCLVISSAENSGYVQEVLQLSGFPPKSSLPALNALRGPPFSLSLEKHSIGFLGNNETSHESANSMYTVFR